MFTFAFHFSGPLRSLVCHRSLQDSAQITANIENEFDILYRIATPWKDILCLEHSNITIDASEIIIDVRILYATNT